LPQEGTKDTKREVRRQKGTPIAGFASGTIDFKKYFKV
jgi:hypothetical protein